MAADAAAPRPTARAWPASGPTGLTAALLALLLAATLTNECKLPMLGIGWPNLALPGLGVLLLGCMPDARDALRRRRWPLLAAAVLLAWALVASALSPYPGTALHFWVKSLLHVPLLAACLAWMADAARARQAARVLLGFLVVLALFGLLESLWPAAAPFRALRSAGSLSIQPRVAGLLPWPNQYGILMVLAFVLACELRARDALSGRLAAGVGLLVLSQVAQSGSRNAWVVQVAAFALLVLRRRLRGWQAGTWPAVFALLLVLLPVSALQLGLGARHPLAAALLPARYSGHALADPLQSLSLRSKLWRGAVAELRARPLTGLGPGGFGTHVAPRLLARYGLNTHNLALELAVALGLVGLALAGLALVTLWRPGPGPAGPALTELAWVLLLMSQGADCFVYDPTCVTVGLLLAGGVATADEPRAQPVTTPA